MGTETKKKPLSILLVTSAFHMPREKTQFEANGLQVVAYPVDFLVSSERQNTILDFLQSANALSQTELALREFYGRIFYQIRHAGRQNLNDENKGVHRRLLADDHISISARPASGPRSSM